MSTKIATALLAALSFGTASTASASVYGGRHGTWVYAQVRGLSSALAPTYPTGFGWGYAYPGYPYAHAAQTYNQHIAHLGNAGALPGPND